MSCDGCRRRTSLSSCFPSLLLPLLLLLSGDPVGVQLEYVRAARTEACPDEAALRGLVAAALGYDPFGDEAARTIEVAVARAASGAGGYEARLVIRDGGGAIVGERTLSDRSCGELARAVALAISVAIDPLSFQRSLAPPPPPASPPPPQPPPQPPPEPPPPPPAAEAATATIARSSFALAAGGGAVAALGTVPSTITAGFWLELRGEWERFALGLEGRADAPRSVKLAGRSSASVFVATLNLVPCFRLSWFSACGVGALGALRASGRDLDDARTITRAYAALGLRGALAIPVAAQLELLLRAEVTATLARTTLVVSEEEVWSSPPIAGALGVGIAVRFL